MRGLYKIGKIGKKGILWKMRKMGWESTCAKNTQNRGILENNPFLANSGK